MSGPNSPNLNPLDYEILGNAGVLIQAAIEVKFKNALQLIWYALPEKAIDNAVKDYRKRLQTCLSQGWAFWRFDVRIYLTDINCYI